MTPRYSLAIALLTGIVVGGASMQALKAQNKARAYHIGEVDVFDRDGYLKNFVPLADPITKAGGGKFLARGGAAVPMEGEPPKGRIVILEFETMDQLKAWRASMKDADAVREKYARTRTYAVEGLAGQ
jgi:uncharacterized protein (DUF1330 family)